MSIKRPRYLLNKVFRKSINLGHDIDGRIMFWNHITASGRIYTGWSYVLNLPRKKRYRY